MVVGAMTPVHRRRSWIGNSLPHLPATAIAVVARQRRTFFHLISVMVAYSFND